MRERNKNDVLLTELIIVILVFSLVAVISVQMFVAAHQKSVHSQRLERVLITAQDWAERLSGTHDPAGLLANAGFASLAGTGTEEIVYISVETGESRSGTNVEIRLHVESRSDAGILYAATVNVFEGSARDKTADPLVALPVLIYIPEGVSAS